MRGAFKQVTDMPTRVLLSRLYRVQRELEVAIMETPTSETRNELTEVNLRTMILIAKLEKGTQ